MIEIGKPIFFIDTNILVYALDTSERKKSPLAKQLLEKAWKREAAYITSTQVLAEFFFVATKKMPFPIQIGQAQQIIEDTISFSSWSVISYDQNILKRAIILYQQKKQHFWDLVIIATMLENSITHIYTENDKDYAGFPSLTVVNPFV